MSLNIDDYTIPELLEILNLKPPINNQKVVQAVRNKLNNNLNDEQLAFFYDITNKLINEIKNINDETYEEVAKIDDTNAGKLFKNELITPSDNNLIKKREALTIAHNTQLKDKINLVNVWNKEVSQGLNNPYKIDILKRQITFDSQYRRILDEESCYCKANNICDTFSGNKSVNMYLDFPTDYTINLNTPLHNVVDLTLLTYHIIHSLSGKSTQVIRILRRERRRSCSIYSTTTSTNRLLLTSTTINNSSATFTFSVRRRNICFFF